MSDTDRLVTYERNIEILRPEDIIARVKKIRRPKSMVPGDIPPKLIPSVIDTLLARIFNAMPLSEWPQQWRTD